MIKQKRKLWLTPGWAVCVPKEHAYHWGVSIGYKRAIKKMESMKEYLHINEYQTFRELLLVLKDDLDKLPYSEPQFDNSPRPGQDN